MFRLFNLPVEFNGLWADLNQASNFPNVRPLLAHYTSLNTLEQIVKNEEMWFGNPLYMNDYEELRFGLGQSADIVLSSRAIRESCGTDVRYQLFCHYFRQCFDDFAKSDAYDTYIACFSEHSPDDNDGLLSMWRGYGGNGGGAALVLNLEEFNVVSGSPVIISKVEYLTTQERLNWISGKVELFSKILASLRLEDDQLQGAAAFLLRRFFSFALFTKHRGFSEEKEWRIAYIRALDVNKVFHSMVSYHVGNQWVEPKFKFKIKPVTDLTRPDLSLETLVDRIILGPTAANGLCFEGVRRMLDHCGKPGLAAKLHTSTTPYRRV